MQRNSNYSESDSVKLLTKLYEFNPESLSEVKQKQEMIDFLKHNKDCFERSSKIGHFTASAWVLNSQETHVLLMHHKKLNMWIQLGGHADGEKNLLSVAIKEVLEESGLKSITPITDRVFDIGIHKIPQYKLVEEHLHYDVRFLLKSSGDDTLIKNEESTDIQWFKATPKSLPTQNPDLLRMLNKCMKYY